MIAYTWPEVSKKLKYDVFILNKIWCLILNIYMAESESHSQLTFYISSTSTLTQS